MDLSVPNLFTTNRRIIEWTPTKNDKLFFAIKQHGRNWRAIVKSGIFTDAELATLGATQKERMFACQTWFAHLADTTKHGTESVVGMRVTAAEQAAKKRSGCMPGNRRPFTPAEDEAILRGVKHVKHLGGKMGWERMKSLPFLHGALDSRSGQDLKDRYRNIMILEEKKRKREAEDEAEAEAEDEGDEEV